LPAIVHRGQFPSSGFDSPSYRTNSDSLVLHSCNHFTVHRTLNFAAVKELTILDGYAPTAKCAKGINLLLKALKEIISTGNFAAVAISMRHLLCSSSLVM
jgi:hypothetical protein